MKKLGSIVAWDGEGVSLPNGEHVYTLLSNSEGDCLEVPAKEGGGIRTAKAFDLMLKYSGSKYINIIYGGSYDVNMILKDLSRNHIESLHHHGYVYWGEYTICYKPRKSFSVTNRYTKKTFMLWDVIGYYQSTFVRACREWLGDIPELQFIEEMKGSRPDFVSLDPAEIRDYNTKECVLLVMLFTSLLDAMFAAGIFPDRYDGAGSLASAMLKKNGIKRYKGDEPLEVYEAAQYAYAGGRIEAIQYGITNAPVFQYDINSAYPSVISNLKSYHNATWMGIQYSESDQPTIDDINVDGLYHIKWDFEGNGGCMYPFFYRLGDGSIYYPRIGQGWYWGEEVANAMSLYDGGIQVVKCYIPRFQGETIYPFKFVEEMYERRLDYKRRGMMAHYALKLGLNSLYGKFAQQVGYRPGGKIPPYHQLLWAGQITASIRSRLFTVAYPTRMNVIAFATDAIFVTAELDVPISDKLGEWTKSEYGGMALAQSGVYWLKEDNGEWKSRYRGFDAGTLSLDAVMDAWRERKTATATTTRFVAMGSALAMSPDEWYRWRRWETTERSLDPFPSGKRKEQYRHDYSSGMYISAPADNPYLQTPSSKYKIIWIDGEGPIVPMDGNVEQRIISEEIEDGYA